MTPITIFGEATPEVKERFIQMTDDGVDVKLNFVNRDGKHIPGCALLKINKDTGKIYRYRNVSSEYGLSLDADRRLTTN